MVLEINDDVGWIKDYTQPATLTQPVIHDSTGTHFGQETIFLLEEVDCVSRLTQKTYLLQPNDTARQRYIDTTNRC